MLLLGHRGAKRYFPENTIPAFAAALAHGCDGFEFDVCLTSDGTAVICHDPEVRTLSVAGSTYSTLHSAEGSIPTLEQILVRFAASAVLNIELKVPGIESQLKALLELTRPLAFVVSSFFPDLLTAALHQGLTRERLGFICNDPNVLPLWSRLPVNSVIVNRNLIHEALIAEVHAEGKRIWAWTVNDAEEMRRFADLGVDALISDDTKLLGDVFQRRPDV